LQILRGEMRRGLTGASEQWNVWEADKYAKLDNVYWVLCLYSYGIVTLIGPILGLVAYKLVCWICVSRT
jgi:hypothetical protein